MLHWPIFLTRAGRPACASVLAGFLGGSRRSTQSAGLSGNGPARCYTPTKIWPDSRDSEGRSPAANGEPGAPALLGSRCAEHGGLIKAVVQSVPTAPGAVMVASQTISRNLGRAQSEGRVRGWTHLARPRAV